MAFGKGSKRLLLLLAFLWSLGFMEAFKRAPRPALLYDSHLQHANRKGSYIKAVDAVETQSVITEEAEIVEEQRILFAEGNDLMGNTFDYPPTGPNTKHDPRPPHAFGDESATETKN